MPHKGIVYAFEGTVTKAFNRSSGDNQHGPWSLESFIVKDTTGDDIKLMVKDCDPLGWPIGHRFRLEAYSGDKGFSGLYAFDDEYKGEPRRVLKATSTVQFVGGKPKQQAPAAQQPHQQQAAEPWSEEESQQQQQAKQQQAPAQQQASAPTTTTAKTKGMTPEAMVALREAKGTVMQIVNLHVLCSRAVVGCEVPAVKAQTGHGMSESQIQGAIASVFIESCKNGLVRQMPNRPLED